MHSHALCKNREQTMIVLMLIKPQRLKAMHLPPRFDSAFFFQATPNFRHWPLRSGMSPPAVQLVEGVDASREVGEQRESHSALFLRILRRYRAQQLRDGRVARVAVLRAQVVEDLRLEILQPQVAEADAAGATRAEHDVPLRELGPSAEEPRGFERCGKFPCSHACR